MAAKPCSGTPMGCSLGNRVVFAIRKGFASSCLIPCSHLGGEDGETEPMQEPMHKQCLSHSGEAGGMTSSALWQSILPDG